MEIPAGIKEYPYPNYLTKIPIYLTPENVFGQHPERHLHCNNLMVRFMKCNLGLNQLDFNQLYS